jgi:hypothetical protein
VVIADGWGEVVELVDLLGGQLDAIGGNVLLDPGDALGAGDGGDVVALGQQPDQGDLGRGGADLGGDGLDLVGDAQVALERTFRRRPPGSCLLDSRQPTLACYRGS